MRVQRLKHLQLMLFFLILESVHVYAQEVFVVDSTTLNPIPYITMKQEGSSAGFVGDHRGRIVYDELEDAQYTLSCIGYRTRSYSKSELLKLDTIKLPSSMLELDEVVVRPIPPEAFINQAMGKIKDNYVVDSSHATGFYREWIRENSRFLNLNEAYLSFNQPGYLVKRDSFIIALEAGRCNSEEELQFMRKEMDKELKKQRKQAEKNNETYDEEENEINWEVVNPVLMLQLDPIRHPEAPMHVNDNRVNFLDSTTHDQYNFWYGKPQRFGERTIVVIDFEPDRKADDPLFDGTLWIDQESMAFVKISFGFMKDAEKHLIPGYARALLWVYGLSYEINETLVEFVYQPFQDRWSLSSTHLKAEVDLEKRRMFSENDRSSFIYEGELLVQSMDKGALALNGTLFDPKEKLSLQIEALDPNPWESFRTKGRKIRR